MRREIYKASEALDSWDAAWPWYDEATGTGGNRRIVLVTGVGITLDDPLRVVVNLPPGCVKGPQAPPSLGAWGASSGLAHRLLLNLAYAWYEPGRTHVPVGSRRRQYWVPVDDPIRYEELSDRDLVEMAFPAGSNQRFRQQLYNARKALWMLEQAGDVRINGHRVLPPARKPDAEQ